MRTTALRTSLSAAAALLLVIGGAACTNDDPTSTPTLEPAPTGEASDGGGEPQQTPSEDATAGECQVRSGDEALPNEAPKVDAWEDISGTPVPTSETYGPDRKSTRLNSSHETISYADFCLKKHNNKTIK